MQQPLRGTSVQIAIPSPCGRGAAVFEAGAENYGCGEGAVLAGKKSKNRKDINMKTLSSIFPSQSNSRSDTP